MKALSDSQLLRDFADHRSEEAFSELVSRHIDLVHSAAFRLVNDTHLAKDVTQAVFVEMMGNSGKLAAHPVLCGWLHRTARNIAAKAVRTEFRRRRREQEAAIMNESFAGDTSWEELSPHLDAALGELEDSDRDALLLRFFQNRTMAEIATVQGISAEAAQKRVRRGIEKLRKNLARRGVCAGTAGLASVISVNAVQPAPAGLAVAVGSGTIAATVVPTALGKFLALMTLHKTALTAGASAIVIIGVIVYQIRRGVEPRVEPRPVGVVTPVNEPRGSMEQSLVETMARTRAETPQADRRAELEKLKELWMQTRSSNDRENLDRQIELSRQSAEVLLCSREVIELIAFVKDRKFYSTIDSHVEGLFSGPRAAEARELLIGLPDPVRVENERGYSGGDPWRDKWSLVAGRHCPDEEFDAFREALRCPHCGTQAVYGRNLRLMETDPETAFTSSLETFLSGSPSVAGRYGVTDLFGRGIKVPEGTDFAAFEGRLPLEGKKPEGLRDPHWTDPIREIRQSLLRKWAEMDPAAAANHVMAHPDRMAPEYMESIVSSHSNKDLGGTVAWIATFPEGPYFDAAAAAAAIYTRAHQGTRDLVLRIGDEKIREEALKKVAIPAANPGTR